MGYIVRKHWQGRYHSCNLFYTLTLSLAFKANLVYWRKSLSW